MLKQYVQRMKHVLTDDVVVRAERVCDCCGEIITGPFFTTFTQRTDCDSEDPGECRDYCSDKCLKWAVELYLENVHKGREQFFEIESRDNPVSLQEETRIINDPNDILKVQHVRID